MTYISPDKVFAIDRVLQSMEAPLLLVGAVIGIVMFAILVSRKDNINRVPDFFRGKGSALILAIFPTTFVLISFSDGVKGSDRLGMLFLAMIFYGFLYFIAFKER